MSGDLAAAVTVRSFLTVRDRFPVTGEVKQGLWGIFPACRECALWPYFRARVCYGYNYHHSVTTRENAMCDDCVDGDLRMLADGFVPSGQLEPLDDRAKSWVAAHGPVTTWKLPDSDDAGRSPE